MVGRVPCAIVSIVPINNVDLKDFASAAPIDTMGEPASHQPNRLGGC